MGGARRAEEDNMADERLTLVFDVNETLLDLRALDAPFERIFGDATARPQWFQQLLQSALVTTVTDSYVDFGSVGRAALQMTATRRSRDLTDEEAAEILGTVRRLPPHADVPAALERLAAAGHRLATLTNSTEQVAQAQLQSAGLAPLFEKVLSADSVQRLKPAPQPYRMAAEALEVPLHEMWLIAAHAWDVVGAKRAGARAALVARPGVVADPLGPAPDIIAADLGEVADQLLAATAY
jgi:2-haloacid dehalogenase